MDRTVGKAVRKNRRIVLPLLVAVAAMILAACGSGTPSGSPSSSTSSGGSSGGTAIPASVRSLVQKLATRPTKIAITTPVKGTIPTGKVIDYVECPVPGCTNEYAGFQAAAKVLGWTVKGIVVPTQTPANVQAAMTQAINDHPDAIVSIGYSKSQYVNQWNQIVADHIANVTAFSTDANSPSKDYFVTYGAKYNTNQGAQMADFAYVNQGASLRPLVLNMPAVPVNQDITNGFVNRLKNICSKCTSDVLNIATSAIGTTAGAQIVSYIQGHPGINAVFATYDGLSLGLSAALNQAGVHNVKLYGSSPGTGNFQNIADGTESGAYDTPIVSFGYQFADLLARFWAGDSTAPDTQKAYAEMILTSKNIPSTTQFEPIVANGFAQFKQLWGKG